MRKLLPLLLLFLACATLSPIRARAQEDEAPSLGDVARKARLEKQQQKDAVPKPAQAGADAQPANLPASGAQSKDAPPKDAGAKATETKSATAADAKNAQPLKTKKVITNEELPEHVGPTHTSPAASGSDADDQAEASEAEGKAPPDYWRTRILSEKNAIAALKSDIESLTASIQYAGGNCVSGCVQWNERQQQKQQQVEAMKAQLEQQEKTLEDMQDMARKQGYGSSVYDP
ncbi:MAG TPA: hypothetical protein VKV39_18465 [Candidatus Sulfotelmatobacter sp.]|nr:hypothetical protein [Candidatus Sulfotelmatobacter sp.]